MKYVILLCTCVLLASVECRPQPQFGLDSFVRTIPQILNYNYQNFLRGFSFSVDTSDKFHHDAKGELRSETGREDDEGIEVQGSYSYIGDDGKEYRVDYTAGKDGFRPAGAHLPPSAGVKKLGVSGAASASLTGTGLG